MRKTNLHERDKKKMKKIQVNSMGKSEESSLPSEGIPTAISKWHQYQVFVFGEAIFNYMSDTFFLARKGGCRC